MRRATRHIAVRAALPAGSVNASLLWQLSPAYPSDTPTLAPDTVIA
jgi:hypothetical protein